MLVSTKKAAVRSLCIIAFAIACVIYVEAKIDAILTSVRQEYVLDIAKEYQKHFADNTVPFPTQKSALKYAENVMSNWEKSNMYEVGYIYPKRIDVTLKMGLVESLVLLFITIITSIALAFNHRKVALHNKTADDLENRLNNFQRNGIIIAGIIIILLTGSYVLYPTVIKSFAYFSFIYPLLVCFMTIAITWPYFHKKFIQQTGRDLFYSS